MKIQFPKAARQDSRSGKNSIQYVNRSELKTTNDETIKPFERRIKQSEVNRIILAIITTK